MSGGGCEGDEIRLLPWTEQGDKTCYVIGDGTGYVSRLADGIEGVQLGMAGDLIGHATSLLVDPKVTWGELHFLASRLTESLREVKQVAESRDSRLGAMGPDPGVDTR
ncbi:hypothetical protein P8A22_25580 [Streptomyces laculatispora]|uniref:Uncharacterized protein n=1 Tax=Streptomyces laculatispora TaxID=887464 RepID=A0ABY9I813_9ACTN|nr:hypothetical protein [Streptomyces laculatispora]WLQ43007.1 hypothetical protein P8A22_25580 [Streptomyces laculatispora]